jgi:hypothetical protein
MWRFKQVTSPPSLPLRTSSSLAFGGGSDYNGGVSLLNLPSGCWTSTLNQIVDNQMRKYLRILNKHS